METSPARAAQAPEKTKNIIVSPGPDQRGLGLFSAPLSSGLSVEGKEPLDSLRIL